MNTSGIVVCAGIPKYEKSVFFWGEWESESNVSMLNGNSPRFLHSPILTLCNGKSSYPVFQQSRSKKLLRQNTDPFVFGDVFYYSCCKQQHTSKGGKKSPSFMQSLPKGSIILFGSTINQNTSQAYFAIDTVFVVGESRKYCPSSVKQDLRGFMPPYYEELMNFTSWSTNEQYTCYKGVCFGEAFNGMYSYVPCKIGDAAKKGFERPKITNSMLSSLGLVQPIVTDNLNSSPKGTFLNNTNDVLRIWNEIRNIILKQGFVEGIGFNYQLHNVP